MPKRIEWTPQARSDVRRIDRQTALGLLEELADFALTGHGDVTRLTDVDPPEFRLRLGDYRIRFTITATGSTYFASGIAARPTDERRSSLTRG